MAGSISRVVAIGMLMAMLAGCGGGGGDSTSTPNTPPPPPDTTPEAFAFTSQTNSNLSALVSSNEIMVAGIDSATPVSIAGGEYSINGGAFTSAAGTVTNGQKILVRVTSSSQFVAATSAVLTIGGVAGTFSATTRDADRTPDAFAFPRRNDAARSTWVASDAVTPAGFEVPLAISIQGGEYSIAGASFTAAPGTISTGQSLVIRLATGTEFSRNSAVRVTIGSVSADFAVTTELPNFAPDEIAFDGTDVVYLLSGSNRRIFRWSIGQAHYLDPYELASSGVAPDRLAYSRAQHRVYLGYSTGAIRYLDVTAAVPVETTFATLSAAVSTVAEAGNFIVAQPVGYAYGAGVILNSSGVVTGHGGYYYGYSRQTDWDSTTNRVYYFRDGISPNDLHYDVIDQATGQVSSTGETPYHGTYSIQGPIRASANGGYVLLGSGDIYNQSGLTWAASLGTQLADARWFADGSLVTLTTGGNQTVLRRLSGSNLSVQEQLPLTGQALRLVGTDQRMAVILLDGNAVRIQTYVPSNDSDGDGVPNTTDAFPLDRAASVDTDGDGRPDAWNTGRTQTDSTTGLTLDAFPQDSACWLTSHGSGGVCNYGATIPNYTPDKIEQQGDIIYLLSNTNRRVYRWSIATGQYLNPYVTGTNQGFTTLVSTSMALVGSQQRLYVSYENGAIRYFDTSASTPAETTFATLPTTVSSLSGAGNYLAAQGSGYGSGYVLGASGTITDNGGYYYGYSRDTAWDPTTSRLYYFRDGISPNDLHYDVIDQATGQVTETNETPYHGAYSILPPIRVTVNGQRVLLGSGDIYNRTGLTWAGSVGSQFVDARWFADGSLVTLTTIANQTVLRRLSSTNLTNLEQVSYTGQALRVVGTDTRMVLVLLNGGTVQFQAYVPNNDSDGDGVLNTADAFPLDRAASVDTDGDGRPDAWNAGRTQADSTTGLTLDAFPQDSACWLTSHGSGGVCNYGATIPNYTPDKIEQRGDIIYLLSSVNRRVYRWSIATGQYLNPYVTGTNQGFTTLVSTSMALVGSQQRLYVSYENGAIRYFDTSASTPAETAFATLPTTVSSLSAAGNFLAAQGSGYGGGYVLGASGTITDTGGYYYGYSRETAWDPATSRLYYFRDGLSPNDLHYDVIDQATGQVTDTNETPYHGNYPIGGVIRPSVGGQSVLLGTGDFYNQAGLTWAGTLGATVVDARWLANGTLATLTTSGNQTVLRRLGSGNAATVEQRTLAGEALRVVGSDTAMVVVVMNGGTVQFHNYVPSDDGDNDGVSNAVDAFPLDVAASADSDHDGSPDAWNAGRSQSDSTTGLTLDAFPQDSACWQVAHGSGGSCNPAAAMPDYIPDQVEVNGDVVYLLSSVNRRVYRWSIATGAYLNPWIVGMNTGLATVAPTSMAYSAAHQRMYLGYTGGMVRYIAATATNPTESQFATLPGGVSDLTSAGNFLVVHPVPYGFGGSRVMTSGGVVTDEGPSLTAGGKYTWDPARSRLYYAGSGYTTALYYEQIDQGTGQFGTTGNTQYSAAAVVLPPARVSANGGLIVTGSGEVYADDMSWRGSLGKTIADAHWKDNLLVDVDDTDQVEIRDATTRQVLRSYQYLGDPIRVAFGTSEAYLVHVMNGTTEFIRLPFYDQDGDSIARWWEQLYANGGAGMSDSNSADALTDLDGDGINNLGEYLNHTNPLLADTDADGLTDAQEINTWHTNPTLVDTDGDGLGDQAEVVTHHSDPLDTDSDNDGYSDFIEVLYGGDPNDNTGLPQPLTSYTQTFEGTPNLAAWYSPQQSGGPWAIDATSSHAGTASYRSGAVGNSQTSAVRFRGLFRPGTLSFWARVEAGYCCNTLRISIDGVERLYISANTQWTQYQLPVPLGVHEIEWRYERYFYGPAQNDVGRIDDISFTGQ